MKLRPLTMALVALLGCGARDPKLPSDARPSRATPPPASGAGAPRALAATELAEVPSVTYGPYLGVRPDGALVVWASKRGGKRRFSVVPLSAEGRPRGEPRSVADAPNELGLVAVRPFGSGHVVVYTEKWGSDDALGALCLNANGEPSGAPAKLGSVRGQALWLEVIPTDQGALVLSASRATEGRRPAELSALALNAGCRPGSPASVAKEALAWQAVPLGSGALVTLVRPVTGATEGFGSVDAHVLDAYGNERAKLTVSATPSADLDLDALSLGNRAIVGYSDQRGLEPRVVTAVIDENGGLVRAPLPLTPGDGEQTLMRLVAGHGRSYVAWENLRGSLEPVRRIQLSALDADGRLTGPRAELDYAGEAGGAPELAASPDGLTALTVAPVCPRSGDCPAPTAAPFFVELDPSFTPLAAEPLRLEPLGGRRAELGFGLGCSDRRCFALAALARAPAPVFATELRARSNAWRAPARRLDASGGPRVVEEQALTLAESIAGFALARAGDRTYVAHVTEFDANVPWKPLLKPAADGRLDPLRAKLVLETPAEGLSRPQPLPSSPISLRAHSQASVALAPGDPASGKLLVAWGGVDQGEPQVFVTLLDRTGKRESQRMLTRKKGALGSVTATWVGDGWVVAWIDARAGTPQVYAAKVDARVNRVPREQLVSAPGADARGVALAFDGTSLYAVLAEARGSDAAGRADVYARQLGVRDAAPAGDELRLSSTREHSFAPAIARHGSGFQVAWLEQSSDEGSAASLVTRTLFPDRLGEPETRAIESGEPSDLGLACVEGGCRFALTLADEEQGRGVLALASLGQNGLSPLSRAVELDGARGLSVAPVVLENDVSFVSATHDRAAIRRIRIAW